MLTLITYPAGFGEPSLSPFCVKAEFLLNMSGRPWQREESNDPRKAPRRKFPVLRTPEGLVHDSDNIRAYLSSQGAEFDAGLSSDALGISRAFQRLAEEHLYFLLLMDRWEREETWRIIRDTYFRDIPRPLRGIIAGGLRRTLLRALDAQGLGRLTWDERMDRAEQDLTAISAQLENRPFLIGETPSTADASVAAMLGAIIATPAETPLSRRVAEDAVLSGYVHRAKTAMMP